MRPRVFAIVLNWNGLKDTLECITSIKQQTYPEFEPVIVDNGSTDGSVSAIRAAFPGMKVLANATNLGYAEGNNVGIRYACAEGADYLFLLNNDTILDPHLVEHLVTVAETDERIGAVGPKIFFASSPRLLWSAGGIVNYTETVCRMRGYRRLDHGQFERIEDVDYLSSCAILLRRRAVEEVGLLDVVFAPMYYEDADWCMRAHRQGFRVVYVPAGKVWHKVSVSGGGEYNLRERYLIGFNSVQFMRRYANVRGWLTFFVFAVLSLPALFIVRVFQRRGRAVLVKALGLWDGFRCMRRDTFIR